MGERTMLDFRRDLRAGQEYEDFVQLQLWRHGIVVLLNRSAKFQWEYGESLGGLEIKQRRPSPDPHQGRPTWPHGRGRTAWI